MEIKWLLMLMSVSFFTSCKSENFVASDTARADLLKKYYQLSVETGDVSHKQKFFDHFPSTFQEFVSLYGYDDKNGKAQVLYKEAHSHIQGVLCQLTADEIPGYYNKLIGLTYGAKWEADAVSYLQRCIRKQFGANTDLFVKALEARSQDQMSQFFAFYFSGPPDHPLEKIPAEVEAIRSKNAKVYNIALDVFRKLQKGYKR